MGTGKGLHWSEGVAKSLNLPEFLKKHNTQQSPIRWLKVDCEACEFETIPDLRELLVGGEHGKGKVQRLAAELHFNIAANKANGVPSKAVADTKALLEERGCKGVKDTGIPVTILC